VRIKILLPQNAKMDVLEISVHFLMNFCGALMTIVSVLFCSLHKHQETRVVLNIRYLLTFQERLRCHYESSNLDLLSSCNKMPKTLHFFLLLIECQENCDMIYTFVFSSSKSRNLIRQLKLYPGCK